MLLMKHSRSSENAIFQGFVEFRYNLGSGPAILRSLRKVTDVILLKVLYCHIMVLKELETLYALFGD